MDFAITDIFPNAPLGLKNIGFFFGAGTSKKAGYPLMPALTTSVLKKIPRIEFEILDDLVNRNQGVHIDIETGNPNIEIISDVLESAILTIDQNLPEYTKFNKIRDLIREKIVECLLIDSPDFSDHIRFFTALNRIFSGRSENIWIFTPNYDLLFEIAASRVKIPLNNGFIGTSLRFFNNQSFNFSLGTVEGKQFHSYRGPVFKLMKLHGSLDWWKSNDTIFNTENPKNVVPTAQRILVLPRRKKLTDTLESPYNDIFRYSEKILGSQCKYLVSCGYSFGDEHINDILLLPKLQQNKIKFTAFVKEEPPAFATFKNHAAFFYGTESSMKKTNRAETSGTELWQFEKLVDLLWEHAGL